MLRHGFCEAVGSVRACVPYIRLFAYSILRLLYRQPDNLTCWQAYSLVIWPSYILAFGCSGNVAFGPWDTLTVQSCDFKCGSRGVCHSDNLTFCHSDTLTFWHFSASTFWPSGNLALWESGILAIWHSDIRALSNPDILTIGHSEENEDA